MKYVPHNLVHRTTFIKKYILNLLLFKIILICKEICLPELVDVFEGNNIWILPTHELTQIFVFVSVYVCVYEQRDRKTAIKKLNQ